MLWEREFYEDGETIADRIANLILKVNAQKVADIAIEARDKMKLRHVPLLIVREMARYDSHKKFVADTLVKVIQRPDELTEFLALYWGNGRCPLSAQVKKGLAKAFSKFNEYSLAKYNRDDAIKLRDVMFLSHPKPKDKEQEEMWKRLVDGELKTPETWEVALSGGCDKKEAFTRLLKEGNLGALALLRNLRKMNEVGVDDDLVRESLSKMDTTRVLPFRFIAAARYAPQLEPELEQALFGCVKDKAKLLGKTILLIDVSGSMGNALSNNSEMLRIDAGCGVSMIARELCEEVEVFSFSQNIVAVPPRRGFALRDAIVNSQEHSCTYLGRAVRTIDEKISYNRLIVLTDEQSHDTVPSPKGRGYMVNVASNKNGIGYGKWIHIDGFSESVLDWIVEYEQ